jgi:hypothetical protein
MAPGGRMRAAHPDAVPVVALASAPMKTRFRMKSKPAFKITGWKLADGKSIEQAKLPPLEQELDDVIGF